MITPNDIDNVQFTKGRGYKDEEVDDFLEQLSSDLKALIDENNSLKANLEQLQSKYEETVSKYANIEAGLYNTLESAKSLMADIAQSAEKRADVIIGNAEIDAENILKKAQSDAAALISDTETKVNKLKSEESYLQTKVANIKSLLATVLSNELKSVENMDTEVFGVKLNKDLSDIEAEFSQQFEG